MQLAREERRRPAKTKGRQVFFKDAVEAAKLRSPVGKVDKSLREAIMRKHGEQWKRASGRVQRSCVARAELLSAERMAAHTRNMARRSKLAAARRGWDGPRLANP